MIGFAGMVTEETRLASGLFGLQSSGGKDTRQKLGQGFEKATPTSGVSVDPELMSATVQPTSSLVARCLIRSFWPKHGLAQMDQRTVGIDNLGLGALREGRPVGMLARYQDRNR